MSGLYAMFSIFFYSKFCVPLLRLHYYVLFGMCWFVVSACEQVIVVDVFIVSSFLTQRLGSRIYIVL